MSLFHPCKFWPKVVVKKKLPQCGVCPASSVGSGAGGLSRIYYCFFTLLTRATKPQRFM